MTESEVRQGIDLGWVTFSEKDPSVPCVFVECESDANYMLTTIPCQHKYPFCASHTGYTRGLMSEHMNIRCKQCPELVRDIIYKPIKRG